ncbi:MAG: methylenetetrahydrofolate--tRNA-(uracil(54)-C(5))-methyltransferase (FADH(2)-oxidizing) TrmFO, partial [Oligoflexia bacterium]|nr:methylenetetrahydrofolate--tRNA-(uracil(54)-C(5))-methyltransferase (FADH(2)-oxidizing) TrmFO [Oligoflexia bacterium]
QSTSHGILKSEMELFNSLVLKAAYKTRVPAGGALAVDRTLFSEYITNEISNHKNISLIKEEVIDPIAKMKELSCNFVVLASGPLTTESLEEWIKKNIAESNDDFYFYDAIAPVVEGESLDYSKLYWKDRYKDRYKDSYKDSYQDNSETQNQSEVIGYLNAPLNKEQYEQFVQALIDAQKVDARDFEELKFFESCLPIDVMAQRGKDTLRFSCMKPVGLEFADGKRPYAVVQLRRENLLGDAYNLVGFQTRLTYREQDRIFKMIPGFENANFLKFGSIHRNSFLFAKKVLNCDLSSKKYPELYFAGQITGVEGYTESAASGIFVAHQIYKKICSPNLDLPYLSKVHNLNSNWSNCSNGSNESNESNGSNWPLESAIGSLINYLMTLPLGSTPTPTNINMGLFPPILPLSELPLSNSMVKKGKFKMGKNEKRKLIAERALKVMNEFCFCEFSEEEKHR